jgi:hypothetical protein
MTDMLKDLNEAISKNLPAAVGSELKKRLEQAEANEKELKRYQEMYPQREKELAAARTELDQFRASERAAKAREDAVTAREKEIQKLELTAQFEKEKTGLVLGMFNTVFRNRVVREEALVQRDNVTRQEYAGGGVNETKFPVQVEEKKTTEHE